MQRLFITSYENARFMQTTACTPQEVCLILWVKYSQFFAFHYPFAQTIATTFTSRVMFYFEYYSFFALLKTSVIPHHQD